VVRHDAEVPHAVKHGGVSRRMELRQDLLGGHLLASGRSRLHGRNTAR
jgi:hypothetical protein